MFSRLRPPFVACVGIRGRGLSYAGFLVNEHPSYTAERPLTPTLSQRGEGAAGMQADWPHPPPAGGEEKERGAPVAEEDRKGERILAIARCTSVADTLTQAAGVECRFTPDRRQVMEPGALPS
jgi:hypothetical protein